MRNYTANQVLRKYSLASVGWRARLAWTFMGPGTVHVDTDTKI